MDPMKSYLIGRDLHCDVVIADPTIGRQHCELISDSDTHFILVDRDSMNGTFLWKGEEWSRIKTVRVARGDKVRLGLYETSIEQLMRSLAQSKSSALLESRTGPSVVERNPETGEIISRSKG
jgi:pSer/pThr/pTyr-binding forkhead associated (FHA) protein